MFYKNINYLILLFIVFTSLSVFSLKVLSDQHTPLKMENIYKLLKEKNFENALSSLNQMSKQNNLKAQHLYSQIFYSGNIVPQDFEKAYFWSNVSNLGGFKKAETIISLLEDVIEKEQKFKINEKIRLFLEEHALKKNRLAILQIAKWYLTLSEEIDYINAYKWYNIAVAIGIKTAGKKRDEMIQELNSEQIFEAQKLSNEIFKKLKKTGG